MPKRGDLPTVAPQPSKPPGRKSAELPRAGRPSQLVSSTSAHLRRNSKAITSPSAHGDDDNNSSASSLRTSARDSEPATDEESLVDNIRNIPSEPIDHGSYSQFEASERQAVAMLNKITKKSKQNHQKYDAFRDSIFGKDKQVDALRASFEHFACQTAGLEALCNSDVDGDTLEKLFMAIPLQQRQLYLGE